MSKDTMDTKASQDSNMTESFYDEDFPSLCDLRGKHVLIEHIDFSFENLFVMYRKVFLRMLKQYQILKV